MILAFRRIDTMPKEIRRIESPLELEIRHYTESQRHPEHDELEAVLRRVASNFFWSTMMP